MSSTLHVRRIQFGGNKAEALIKKYDASGDGEIGPRDPLLGTSLNTIARMEVPSEKPKHESMHAFRLSS